MIFLMIHKIFYYKFRVFTGEPMLSSAYGEPMLSSAVG